MNVVQRSRQRLSNLAQRPAVAAGWFRMSATADGPTRVDIYDEIGGGGWFSDGVTAVDFVKQLAGIDGDLEVHINSPGGDVFDGLAIYNALMQRPGGVTTVVDGLAASAASFIAQAGTTRVIAPGAMMMIHDASGLCIGNAGDMRELADLLDKVSDNIAAIYADAAGNGTDWRAAMRAETWYTADEAVAAGLAHRVAERPAASALAAAAKFDLSAYLNPPGLTAAAAASHEPFTGTHAHPHSADGDQGGDATHEHEHSHDGDADHEHGHDGPEDKGAIAVADRSGHDLTNAAGEVDETDWDGPAAMSAAAKSDDPAAAYKAICAGRRDGEPDKQASWALPHHKAAGDPPNADGVRNSLSRLPQTEGLTNEAAAKAHLDAHMAVISPGRADDAADIPAWLHDHLRETHDHADWPAWLNDAEEAK